MATDKLISEQMKRMATLRQTLFDQKIGDDDIAQASGLRKERAVSVRTALDRLRRHRRETVARLDAEIDTLEKQLKELERQTDMDVALQKAGAPSAGKGPRRAKASEPAAKRKSRSTKTKS
jgi:septal ring factor EnvC (AmiA/AmiB activator)